MSDKIGTYEASNMLGITEHDVRKLAFNHKLKYFYDESKYDHKLNLFIDKKSVEDYMEKLTKPDKELKELNAKKLISSKQIRDFASSLDISFVAIDRYLNLKHSCTSYYLNGHKSLGTKARLELSEKYKEMIDDFDQGKLKLEEITKFKKEVGNHQFNNAYKKYKLDFKYLLKEILLKYGSINKFCKKIQIGSSTLNKIFQGKTKASMRTDKKIFDVLGISFYRKRLSTNYENILNNKNNEIIIPKEYPGQKESKPLRLFEGIIDEKHKSREQLIKNVNREGLELLEREKRFNEINMNRLLKKNKELEELVESQARSMKISLDKQLNVSKLNTNTFELLENICFEGARSKYLYDYIDIRIKIDEDFIIQKIEFIKEKHDVKDTDIKKLCKEFNNNKKDVKELEEFTIFENKQ